MKAKTLLIGERRKLGINLIPKTAWYKNLRSEFNKDEWDVLRKDCYKKAGYVCEICGGRGEQWPVECHEIWDFSKWGIQKLVRLIALCPMCHKCQHPGLAQINGEFEDCVKHYMKINEVNEETARKDFTTAFKEWSHRNETNWKLDISVLTAAQPIKQKEAK